MLPPRTEARSTSQVLSLVLTRIQPVPTFGDSDDKM
jgi:hypothetical protein